MRCKFITLGCKVNQYETQAIKERFLKEGHESVEGSADIYIINTCTVTSRADKKSREMILRAKRNSPYAKIAVTGCLAQRNRDAIERLGVDYIVPQDSKNTLVDVILKKPISKVDGWDLKVSNPSNQRAFIKIQDGCDNRCSFCKVTLVRGRSRSRPMQEVIDEVNRIAPLHEEIVLCGINICLYGKDLRPKSSLVQLVRKVLALPMVTRVRLSSLEPYLVDEKIIGLFSHPKMCPHVHLPFQSGDDEILRIMNKKESIQLYESIVERIRDVNPFSAVSCDIIIGVPGETEQSFLKTCDFLKRIKPMRTHIFTFSARQETFLANAKPCKTHDTKRRFRVLKKITQDLSLSYMKAFLGRQVHMIAEDHTGGFTCGYTEYYIRVALKEKIPLGKILPVRVEDVSLDKVLVSCVF